MRTFGLLAGLLCLLPACDEDEFRPEPADGTPTLSLRLQGEPAFVTGAATVVVEAAPAGAFYAVEVSIGETRVATLDTPPFEFTLDSTVFPDGPATLHATGMLWAGGEPLVAETPIEVANVSPTLVVASPADGETVVGSPRAGFRIRPSVTAEDGNGIDRITADAGAGEVALVAGSSEVEVPLADVGTEFPRLPVTVTFRAVDRSGATQIRSIEVLPTNEAFRFLAAERQGAAAVEELWSIAPGRMAFRTVTDLYVPARDGTTSFSLEGHMVQTGGVVLGDDTGRALFFTDFYEDGITLWRVPAIGAPAALRTVHMDQNQYVVLPPLALASHRLVLGYWDGNESKTHLLVFGLDGTLALDATNDLVLAASFVAEAADGTLLAVTGIPGGQGTCVQPFDPVDFAPGDCWLAPAPLMPSMFLLVDTSGVILAAQSPSEGGPPSTGLVAFDRNGTVLWTAAELLPYSDSLRKVYRRGDGRVVGVVTTTDPARRSGLRAWAPDGTSTPVWEAPAGRNLTDFGPIGDDLIIGSVDPATGFGSLHRIGLDGTVRWTFDTPEETFTRLDSLEDGSLVLVTGLPGGAESALRLLDADGRASWEVTLPTPNTNVLDVLEHGDSLLVAYHAVEGDAHVYEELGRTDGERSWVHRVAGTSAAFSTWPLLYDEAWDLLVGPVTVARDEDGTPYCRPGLVGFVP